MGSVRGKGSYVMILIIAPQINNEERRDVVVVGCPCTTNDDCSKGGLFVCDDVSSKLSSFVKTDRGKRRFLEASYFLQGRRLQLLW